MDRVLLSSPLPGELPMRMAVRYSPVLPTSAYTSPLGYLVWGRSGDATGTYVTFQPASAWLSSIRTATVLPRPGSPNTHRALGSHRLPDRLAHRAHRAHRRRPHQLRSRRQRHTRHHTTLPPPALQAPPSTWSAAAGTQPPSPRHPDTARPRQRQPVPAPIAAPPNPATPPPGPAKPCSFESPGAPPGTTTRARTPRPRQLSGASAAPPRSRLPQHLPPLLRQLQPGPELALHTALRTHRLQPPPHRPHVHPHRPGHPHAQAPTSTPQPHRAPAAAQPAPARTLNPRTRLPHPTAFPCGFEKGSPGAVQGPRGGAAGLADGVYGCRSAGGPSPRARGADPRRPGYLVGAGTIPAGAGSSRDRRREGPGLWDHPRVHGEQFLTPDPQFLGVGPSPHARGADPGQDHGGTQRGAIPADAGRVQGTPLPPCEVVTRDSCCVPAVSQQAYVPSGKRPFQLLVHAANLAICGIYRFRDSRLLASCLV